MRRFLVAFLLLFVVTAPSLAQDGRRVALVIGNNDYKSEGRLQNAINDAQLVAASLKTAKFETIETKADLGIKEFLQSLRQFQRQADGADVALIYFSGHGVEANGNNWLIPTDAVLAGDRDLEYEAIRIDLALQALAGARMRIMVLDACRNNPFGRNWRAGSRNLSRGLRAVDSAMADDVLLLYAAAPGQTASDGAGSNSPFAAALAKRLPEPGLAVQLLGGLVRDDVIASTGGTQRPYIGGSFTGRPFYLVPAIPVPVVPPVAIPLPPPPVLPSAEAAQAWSAVQNSTSEWALETFIRRYGDTFYGELAKGRLEELKRTRAAVVPPVASHVPQTLVAPAPAAPKVEARPAEAAKSEAPKAAVPKVAMATPPKAPAAVATTPAKTPPNARAIETCKQLIADPIEQLAPVMLLMRGPGDEDIIEAKAVEIASACRSLAAAEPANAHAVLFATMTESFSQVARADYRPDRAEQARVVETAIARLKLLADTGHADAMAAHAIAYALRADGPWAPQDKARGMQEALRLARVAAEKGSPWAAATLALIQLGPDNGFQNVDDGLKWLRIAAAKGPPGLTAALGFVLSEPRHEKLRTPELAAEGLELFKKAGERGSRLGQFFAALPATRDPSGLVEAKRLVRQFADAGGPLERFLLARAMASAEAPDLVAVDAVEARTRLTAAAEGDDPIVTWFAADLIAAGEHFTKDVETAIKWYQRAANGGNPVVTLEVAKRFLEGDKQLPRFLVEGHRFLLLAAEQGDGAIALRAAGLAIDDIERARLLKLAASKSDPETTAIIAGKLAKGDGVAADMAAAAALYTRAAETGGAALAFEIVDSVALEVLGGGKGVDAGKIIKLRLLRLAAASADGPTAFKIAEWIVGTGSGQDLSRDVAKTDIAEAARLYKRAAETTTDPATLLRIARVFVNGGSIAADREEAARLYRRAAEAGGPDIALEVAQAFGGGQGVLVNQVEAAKWLKVVAASEQPSHILAAAEAYAAGKIVPKNEGEATRLYKLVAEKGDRANKFIVANRFLNGVGVTQNAPDGIQILRSIGDEHVGAMDQLAELYDKGSSISQDVGEAAAYALRAVRKRGSLSAEGFDKYAKTYSAEFRKAVQTALKASKHYTGAIDGNFGPAVKKALEAFAK